MGAEQSCQVDAFKGQDCRAATPVNPPPCNVPPPLLLALAPGPIPIFQALVLVLARSSESSNGGISTRTTSLRGVHVQVWALLAHPCTQGSKALLRP